MQISVTIPAPSNPPYLHHLSDPILHPTPRKPAAPFNLSLSGPGPGQGVGRIEAVKGPGVFSAIGRAIEEEEYRKARAEVHRKGFDIDGFAVEGVSIGGHETCIILPEFKSVFDIGRCPLRAVHQNFLFITHGHLDHIGGLPMYVATRALYSLKPPTIFVPPCLKDDVEKLFEIHRSMGQVELNFDLVAIDVGETYELRDHLVVRPFQTHHVIPSQHKMVDVDVLQLDFLLTLLGYVIYSIRKKLKKQYIHLKGNQIEKLKKSGVEITDMILSPEVAFTGDTTSDFLLEPRNADALRAKLLITEATFLDDGFSIEQARERGHTHLYEDIRQAVSKLQARVSAKVVPLTEGFKSKYK
ncbi:hypothetical protein KSS87_006909 [Heliosperma pusillum]|nr:hypothetical protein KSS87_006909 [Heliosperma pusillum]